MKKWMMLGLMALFANGAIAMELIEGSTGIELNGEWQVSLPNDAKTYTAKLPGTLDEAGIGKVAEPEPGALSRKVKHIGPATYTKEVSIPKSLDGKELELFLERVMWKSEVKVDGKAIPGAQESLATPHIHKLGKLPPGKHKVEITIDNGLLYNIGIKGHAYGEAMQTIWNGVVGEFTIRPVNPIRNVFVDAPWPSRSLTVNFDGPAGKYTLSLKYKNTRAEADTDFFIEQTSNNFTKTFKDDARKSITVYLQDTAHPWNEFTPNLYDMLLVLDGNPDGIYTQKVGFRTLTREGRRMFINGKPLFLRGNLDNCHFPLTGYPAMTKKEWLRIMKINKENGLNNVRFHSWCPPKAAFEAADELGLYLAPEDNLWIDGWMANRDKANKYVGVGQGDANLDKFVKEEMDRILATYGNNTSMTMFCFGNELGNANFKLLGQWLEAAKAKDSRFLYSASTARAVSSGDDYNVTHSYPGVGGTRQRMYSNTNWDYEGQYSKTDVPCVAHEIGQWPVYPDFAEIDQYTGVLKPTNLLGFKAQAEEKGTLRYNKEFAFASGMQCFLMYKDEIESFMRTPSCAGIHLLGILDYSGQGEALIGWLNSFYEEKGTVTAADIRKFFAPTVMTARIPKYGWKAGEEFQVDMGIHHYGEKPLKRPRFHCQLKNGDGQVVIDENIAGPSGQIQPGTVQKVGAFALNQEMTLKPGRYTITAQAFDGDKAVSDANSWNIWVFPADITEQKTELSVTTDIESAIAQLKEGKTVVLDASKLGNNKSFVRGDWGSVYWSTIWFPGQTWRSLGCWQDKTSPVFKNFGSQGYADWIWRDIAAGGRAFRLDGLADFRPIAMPVPDFHFNDRLGTLFELKVGTGKLFVSGYNLSSNNIGTQQLKHNILQYAETFNPAVEAPEAWLRNAFAPVQVKIDPRPAKFKDAAIYIEPALRVTTVNKNVDYDAKLDRAELAENCKYKVEDVTMWKDKDGAYWVMKAGSKVTLEFPSGETGKLFVRFRDPNKNDRSGKGVFEGRPFTVPKHQQFKNGEHWLELNIDREDSLDGKLEFTVEPTTGPNLMIDRFIYMQNKSDS